MENIIIKYEADTSGINEATDALNTLKSKEQELLNKMKELEQNKAYWSNSVKGTSSQIKIEQEFAKELSKTKSELDSTKKSIEQLSKSHKDLEETIAKGATNQALPRQLRAIRQEMMEMEMAGDTSSQRFRDLQEQAGALKDQIDNTAAQVAALSSDTKGLDAAMGVGQGLTGAFTAATSAAALLGGENEELQKAFFKVQAALQVLSGVQMVANVLNKDSAATVVIRNSLSKLFTRNKVAETAATTAHTAATGAETAATTAATVATKGFTKALLANPVFWILAAITGVVAGISALVKALNYEEREQEKLNALMAVYLENEQKRMAIRKQISDERISTIENERKVMESAGASVQEIAAMEEQALKKRLAYAQQEAIMQADKIAQIDSNRLKVESLTKALDKMAEAEKDGKGKFEYEVKYMFEGKERIMKKVGKVNDEVKERLQQELDNANNQLSIGIDAEKGLADADSDLRAFYNKQEQEAKERANRSATAAAEYRVLMARKGSEEELKAREASIISQRDIELQNVNLTSEERRKIVAKANEDIRKLNEDFTTRRLQDEKTGYEAQLALVKEGSQDEFDLKLKALEKQKEIDLNNTELTANGRLKIENEHQKQLDELRKDFNRKQSEDELNTQIAGINARLATVKKGSQDELDLKKDLSDKQAELERKSVEATVTNETLRAGKIAEIDAKLKADREQADKDYRQSTIEHNLAMSNAEIQAERIKNEKIMASGGFIERLKARESLKSLELKAIDAEMQALEEKHRAGIVSEKEYQAQLAAIRNESATLELESLQEQQEAIKEVRQAAFDFAVGIVNGLYDSKKAALQQELEDLHHYYTTDAEEAKNNANLKLISEEEMARRELDIKRKQAKADKEQAIFNAVISTITAVAGTLAQKPIGIWNIALAAIMAATGAIQIAKASSQPLPKYAKGRKGGKGEMAWIGERGPEIMWIPEGASIIPAYLSKNLTPEAMKRYDIPMPQLPQMPHYEVDTTEIRQRQYGLSIDYDKLGRAVADNVRIPDVSQLNVNMDEDGFKKYLIRGRSETKLLNKWFSTH